MLTILTTVTITCDGPGNSEKCLARPTPSTFVFTKANSGQAPSYAIHLAEQQSWRIKCSGPVLETTFMCPVCVKTTT